ncbi:MAG TPA: glucosamine-6-phosphate deaminase [Thermoanaerobaculia bacterium]|nr:glucosamine-6-phosphate deaminase [Thermoanaerobaculia bacterium]
MIEWRVVDDYNALSREAAGLLVGRIESHPASVLLLPTGTTPEGMYQEIVARCGTQYRCFRDVATFNLDEYVGVPADHPGSYATYMRTRLFSQVDLDPANAHVPDGNALAIRTSRPDVDFSTALTLECARYESMIRAAGGIDLTFLGLGRNGHIGFNEPGSPFDSRTRVVELHLSTREANAPFFPSGIVPDRAITVGIGTILESRSIVLLASGASKADAIARLASAPPSPDFPASALLGHLNVLAIVDRAAFAKVDASAERRSASRA